MSIEGIKMRKLGFLLDFGRGRLTAFQALIFLAAVGFLGAENRGILPGMEGSLSSAATALEIESTTERLGGPHEVPNPPEAFGIIRVSALLEGEDQREEMGGSPIGGDTQEKRVGEGPEASRIDVGQDTKPESSEKKEEAESVGPAPEEAEPPASEVQADSEGMPQPPPLPLPATSEQAETREPRPESPSPEPMTQTASGEPAGGASQEGIPPAQPQAEHGTLPGTTAAEVMKQVTPAVGESEKQPETAGEGKAGEKLPHAGEPRAETEESQAIQEGTMPPREPGQAVPQPPMPQVARPSEGQEAVQPVVSPMGPLPGVSSPQPFSPVGPTAAPMPPSPLAETRTTEKEPTQEEPRLVFNFKYQPWTNVLEWLASQAGLSLVMEGPPHGTFNYSDRRAYTVAEAIDLINSVLLTKGYVLVRRGKMLILVNLEDGIPPNLVPIVPESELANRGEHELVSILVSLSRLTAEEAQLEIRNLLGPQGSVVVLPKAQQLLITDTAGRLRMIREVLARADSPEGGVIEAMQVFALKHITPEEALAVLRQLLGIPADQFIAPDGSLRLAVDTLGMRLFVAGRANRVRQVADILQAIDVPGPEGSGRGVESSLQLEVYEVAPADPQTVLQVMQTLLAGSPGVRLATDAKTGNLIALARPSEHATIRATLEQMRQQGTRLEVIPLRRLDPQIAATAITKLLAGQDGKTSVKVEVDSLARQLLVRGTETELALVRSLLEKMGESGEGGQAGSQGGTVRVLPIYGLQARQIVERLEQIWPTLRGNAIRVVGSPSFIQSRIPGEGTTGTGPGGIPPGWMVPVPGGQQGEGRPSAVPSGAMPPTFAPPNGQWNPDQTQGFAPLQRPSWGPAGVPSPEPQEGYGWPSPRPQILPEVPEGPVPIPIQPVPAWEEGGAFDQDPSAEVGPGRGKPLRDELSLAVFTGQPKDTNWFRFVGGITESPEQATPIDSSPASNPPSGSSGTDFGIGPGGGEIPSGSATKAGGSQVVPGPNRGSAAQPASSTPEANSLTDAVGGPAAPVIIAPGPNGLVIASQDQEALDLLEELIRMMASQVSSGPQLTIFYLKHARAEAVAEVLDQIFGGGTLAGSSGGTGGTMVRDLATAAFGEIGGGIVSSLLGGGGGTITPSGTLRITPDPRLNALIVQATPVDLEIIDQLLQVLDQKESPEEVLAQPRPRVVPVYNMQASEVAEIVRQVYQDRLITTGSQQSRGGPPNPQEFMQMLQALRGGRGGTTGRRSVEQTQRLSIGVDTRTNSVIVSAPEPLFQEVKQLIEELDAAAAKPPQATQVVVVRRANPEAVQQAVRAMLGDNVAIGRSTPTGGSLGSTSTGTGSGSSDRGRFFRGGFGGFGGGTGGFGGFPGGGPGFFRPGGFSTSPTPQAGSTSGFSRGTFGGGSSGRP